MARAAREKSATGIYHVMIRGNNRQIIFLEDSDYSYFLTVMHRVREISHFKLYAFCLMDNHVHMLIHETDETLCTVFKRIETSYAYYYNKKYEKCGHVFQDRFKSIPVEDDAYFVTLLRYICQNPVRADLCKSPYEYQWLGCHMVDPVAHDFICDSFSEVLQLKASTFKSLILTPVNDEKRPSAKEHHTDASAKKIINNVCHYEKTDTIASLGEEQRAAAVRAIIMAGVPIAQIARITGMEKYALQNALKH